MLVVVELCGISSVVVWPELSAPTSSINIIIITTNYMYVLYVVTIIKHYFIYTVYLYRYMYLDLQWWWLERSLLANVQLPLKFLKLNYLLSTPAGQKYKDLIILNIHSKAEKQ